nr:hypothetical protein [Bovine gammaherpesvirus 4]
MSQQSNKIHRCSMGLFNTPLCLRHKVNCVYFCSECEKIHLCDGGKECVMTNTGENMVCLLTGNCIFENLQGIKDYVSNVYVLEQKCDQNMFLNIIQSIIEDIFKFFTSVCVLPEIQEALLGEEGELKPHIIQLIKKTFGLCAHVFGETKCGYDLICSMYIHVIISIYSSKTVYGNLLFKCTKNKKYDSVVKKMREQWMSTLIIGDSCHTNVTC